jgi:hypothetical protein
MLKRPPLTLLRKGRPKVTNELLLGFVLGAWSAALLALMVLLARAERSLATARGLSEKRASLSGSAYEYRRLLAAAAVGCISWMILAAISYGLARLLGWRL